MIGEVSALRQEQDAVGPNWPPRKKNLGRDQALEKEREHLVEVRAQLNRALGCPARTARSIYEAGSPDVLNAILESENWS